MDFEIYDCSEGREIAINDFSQVDSSMGNEEYFDWTDSLKLDEKFPDEHKAGRKRKLNGNSSSAEATKIRSNGLKVLKANVENTVETAKQTAHKKTDAQNNEGKFVHFVGSLINSKRKAVLLSPKYDEIK